MKILIRHRAEAQAVKILEQERVEEARQRLIGFDEDQPPIDEPLDNLYAIDEADEYFNSISGQYEMIEDSDEL